MVCLRIGSSFRLHPSSFILFLVRFSIITPSYRQLDWLGRCVASVRDQEFPGTPPPHAVEHIIQDAGTEGIEAFARDIGAAFHRDGARIDGPPETAGMAPAPVRIYSERDSGMYDAVNRGLDRATGELCAYLNCDEQYLPGVLARVSAEFERCPDIDVFFGDMIVTDACGQPLSYRQTITPDPVHLRLHQLNTPTCATFFRRRVFDAGHRFPPDWKAIGDAVWMWGLLRAGVRTGLLGFPTSAFFLTGDNLSADPRALGEMCRWREAPDAPPGWKRIPAAAAFRWRKWIAGAYRKRDVTLDIHLPGRPPGRHPVTARKLGTGWPTGA
jgi:glycosyltransferase involved in cell wall biosynthesis